MLLVQCNWDVNISILLVQLKHIANPTTVTGPSFLGSFMMFYVLFPVVSSGFSQWPLFFGNDHVFLGSFFINGIPSSKDTLTVSKSYGNPWKSTRPPGRWHSKNVRWGVVGDPESTITRSIIQWLLWNIMNTITIITMVYNHIE